MKKAKFACILFVLVGSIIAVNCDNVADDSKKNQSLLLLVNNSSSCASQNASGQVTIDGTPKTAFVSGGVPMVAAAYASGLTSVTMCLTSGCTEEILIQFLGQSTGTYTSHSVASSKYIIYTNAPSWWYTASEGGGSGTFTITRYDGCFVEGTFSGTVDDPLPGAGVTHSLTNGSFKAARQ